MADFVAGSNVHALVAFVFTALLLRRWRSVDPGARLWYWGGVLAGTLALHPFLFALPLRRDDGFRQEWALLDLSRWKVVADGVDEELVSSLTRAGGEVVRQNGHLELSARDVAHLNALVDEMRSRGALLRELTPVRESLEDLFVGLVRAGEEADRAEEDGRVLREAP